MDYYLAHPNEFHVKRNVDHKEYFLNRYVANLGSVRIPEVVEYFQETRIMVSKRVRGNNISDNHGEDVNHVPDEVFEKVATIIRELVLSGVEYPDITGYNFIEELDTDDVWIVDFGHANIKQQREITDRHIKAVCNGEKKWNPEYR